ncbi:hypothetical protein DL93DRAFT_1057367 [Clavulina sp. PMI_390]|nr:hypothetical protein DL93DRAFT_1057367 [Clavulina sp. PMI_390]
MDNELDDLPARSPYAYGVVGSAASRGHLPQSSGSMFREEFDDGTTASHSPAQNTSPRMGTGVVSPTGSAHHHARSGSDNTMGAGAFAAEQQGLLRNIDGGETSGPRFMDDVLAEYEAQQRAYITNGGTLTPNGGLVNEQGRMVNQGHQLSGSVGSTTGLLQQSTNQSKRGSNVVLGAGAGGAALDRRASQGTTLSEYPPTPTSRNILLPPGAAPPMTPAAVAQAGEYDLLGLGTSASGPGGTGHRTAVAPPEPTMSPTPIQSSGFTLKPMNPD